MRKSRNIVEAFCCYYFGMFSHKSALHKITKNKRALTFCWVIGKDFMHAEAAYCTYGVHMCQ